MENTKRKRTLSSVTIAKYYDALKKIEEKTKNGFVEISLHSFLIEVGINCKVASVLIEKGILKRQKSNSNKRAFVYKWNTISPSFQMAKAVIDEAFKNNVHKTRKEKPKQILLFDQAKEEKQVSKSTIEKPARKRKEIKNEEKKEISLFWGLFKYKSNK